MNTIKEGNEMKERNEETRNGMQEEEEEMMVSSRMEITRTERLRRLDVIDLGDEGTFYAEYVMPQIRRVYGYWHASQKAIEQLREDGWDVDGTEPLWASIDYYLPDSRTLREEKRLMSDGNTWASDFLKLDWASYAVFVESLEEENGTADEEGQA